MVQTECLDVLLDVAANLDANRFTLLLVGDGEALDELKSSVSARGSNTFGSQDGSLPIFPLLLGK